MSDSPVEQGASSQPPTEVVFHYIKSHQFRVVRVDGAHGGVAPRADAIHMAIFSERFPIPLQVAHAIDQNGRIQQQTSKVDRGGIVREVEADLILTPDVAESLAKWLNEKAAEARRLQGVLRAM